MPGVLRLRDGENQVLAGLLNDEERSSANRIPGLGDVPVVGRLGSQVDDRGRKTEVVLRSRRASYATCGARMRR